MLGRSVRFDQCKVDQKETVTGKVYVYLYFTNKTKMESGKKSTELSIIYLTGDNREVYLRDVLAGSSYMGQEEYVPDNFWCRSGGLEIVIDEYRVIFRSLDFYNLCKIVAFLLHALYKIKGRTSSWFDEESTDSVNVLTTGGHSLTVKIISENVSLSFLRNGVTSDNKVRGERFFTDVILDKSEFYDATKTALSEYFVMLEEIINDNPDDTTAATMKGFLGVWRAI